MRQEWFPGSWQRWIGQIGAVLSSPNRRHLGVLLDGIVLARGLRTVTSWLRAMGKRRRWSTFYYAIGAIGRKTEAVAERLLSILVAHVVGEDEIVRLAIDDTPTRRYGPKVQGAGTHRDPAPGPSGGSFLYGHIWVTLSLVKRHARWGTMGLPLLGRLYIRAKDLAAMRRRPWRFQTKLELARKLVEMALRVLSPYGKRLWVLVDGGYTKRPFLRPLRKKGVTVIGRLRKDAALRTVPPSVSGKRPVGRPPTYGQERIVLAKRAGQKRGWQDLPVRLYGKDTVKRIKTFEATYRPAGGRVRVVIVQETDGYLAFFSSDPAVSAGEILEAVADRGTIEQDFLDLKEVIGAGQQQLRNVWANVGAWNLNLWTHTLVELWAWKEPKSVLVNRADSPWDRADRRPSHADRRKALAKAVHALGISCHFRPRTADRRNSLWIGRLISKLAS